jgi:acyl carrier protein
MTDADVFEGVQGLMCDLFGVERCEVTIDTTQESLKAWDSLQHVNLMIDLENAFGIRIDENEVSSIRSVADVLEVVEQKLNATDKQ